MNLWNLWLWEIQRSAKLDVCPHGASTLPVEDRMATENQRPRESRRVRFWLQGEAAWNLPIRQVPFLTLGFHSFQCCCSPSLSPFCATDPAGLALIFSSFSPNLSQLLSYLSHPILVLFKLTKVQGQVQQGWGPQGGRGKGENRVDKGRFPLG